MFQDYFVRREGTKFCRKFRKSFKNSYILFKIPKIVKNFVIYQKFHKFFIKTCKLLFFAINFVQNFGNC